MKNHKWSDERIIDSLEKSSRLTVSLSRKSRKKIAQALLEENARLSNQKKAQKSQQGLSRILASLSNH